MFTIIVIIVSGQNFELGLRTGAGYNLMVSKSNLKYNQFKPYYSLSNGFSFRYKFPKFFFLRSDINFDRLTVYSKTKSFDDEIIINGQVNDPYDIYYINKADYLNFYILPGFETNGKTKFFYYNGIYLGQLLSNKSVEWTSIDTEKKKRSQDVALKIGWGLAFGLGIKQTLSKNILLSFESRINIPQNAFVKRVPFFNLSNNFLIGIHYSFNNKKNN